ncbi:DUF2393 family protein [Helicobacter cynogastricus]|uniref:DUF2393 family protein n=1 Tax=Helicobacter cynogastricus TaxID=329937 RepID=UPI000CF18ACF|nr:DUF2393 family protein [Helicobacter cynogastricus]
MDIKQHILEILQCFWEQASPLALGIFGAHYAFFILLFCMGIAIRGVISAFLYVFSFLVLFGAPFVVHYATEAYFYKIKATIEHAAALVYTPAFVAQVKIKNEGRLALRKCVLRLDVQQSFHNKFQEILSRVISAKTYVKTFKTALARQEEARFNWSIDSYPYRNHAFKLTANCY